MSRAPTILKPAPASADEASDTNVRRETMMVSPAQAEQWLALNTQNRRLSKGSRAAYARDMKAGKWLHTGDAIRFDSQGKLVDGQHRLAACIEADVPFLTDVIWGLDTAVLRVVDHGRPRSVADNLHIENRRHPLVLAASARWLYVFKYGSIAIGKGRVTATEVLAMVDKHPLLEQSCGVAYDCRGVTASLLAAVHYVGSKLVGEPEKADNFASVFTSGQSYYQDDAALVWRERLLRMKESRTSVAQDFMQRGTIHAWNLFVAEERARIARAPDVVAFEGLDYELL